MSRTVPVTFTVDDKNCFICTSHCSNDSGYPHIHRGYKILTVSRFIWTECFGKIRKGICVLHKCDNRRCINPEHLFIGTKKDNAQDMIKKGRQGGGYKPGERHLNSKLKNSDVLYILESKKRPSELAKQFRVGRSNIWRIKTRKAWKHIKI